ncbi:putative importin beta-3 subunit [Podospora fimiseda]|uniref:Importin beta-3 subunit n=1 Tax=Podospora fimiseda TaxID=252190 RepID=A0AAN7H5E8_9PEZI|nr:putative importin beta-3 subunit [Podospora fimiseda]
MSLLPPEVSVQLSQLLQQLQSPDNSARSTAEVILQDQWTSQKPGWLLAGLVEQLAPSADVTSRQFAAVIFRRIASKTRKSPTSSTGESVDLFISLPKEEGNVIRQKLLEALLNETDKNVRNKISDAVAELARQYSDSSESWPELLQALFLLSQAPDPGKREVAFRVFTTTPGIIEKQHEEAVAAAFAQAFKDDSVAVRLAAMEAFASFFRNLSKKNQNKFHGLLPEVLNILPPIKESQDSEDLSKALVALIDLAESSPRMFKQVFNTLVQFCISVVQDKELSDLCRQNALELMATFADYAPSMCKKDRNYTSDMITQCLSLMTDLGEDDDDAAEWLAADDLDDPESDQNHVAGEQCMDRLANKLGGLVLLQPVFEWLPRMMNSPAWRDRHAALMAISAISEGCREQMVGELKQVLQLVIPALKDAHPRVRWAGCNALGQMSTDFAPNMQKEYAEAVLSAIIPVLDSPEARVKSHAAAALVNFCEEAEKHILEPYLDQLLTKLYQLLQNEKRYVQEQALSTIATIADAAEQAFSKYYDSLMPLLVGVLQRENDKEQRLLRSKAMECATLIALAVGAERLGNDAFMLVELLGKIQDGVTEPDDPQAQYLLHCWGRMCRVMGKAFLPCLPKVMPPLLEMASAKADIQLLDDDEQVEKMQQEEGWELVPLRGKTIGIRTSSMEDKHMAIELLVVYAQVLEEEFATYSDEIMEKIALPGLAFFFHDPVRYVSAKLVPQLLGCVKLKFGPQSAELAALWAKSVDKLLEVLSAEPAVDTLAEMYQCFYEAVEVIARPCLTDEHLGRFIDAVSTTLEDYKDRVAQREEEHQGVAPEDAEDDAEEILMAIEDDQTLLSDMNKAFHCVFKYHGDTFLRHWERLLPTYTSFLKSADATQRQWGLCIIDDVIEFCGPRSVAYAQLISDALLSGCSDTNAAIRQAATYGIGVAARHGGAQFATFLQTSLEFLFRAMNIPGARNEDNIYATENACAAIAKILHFNNSAIPNVQQVATEWLKYLPIVEDDEAAPYAYLYLAELISKQHPAVVGNPSQIFYLVCQALEGNALSGQNAVRVVAATKHLLEATGTDPSPVLLRFEPEGQQAIRAHFG